MSLRVEPIPPSPVARWDERWKLAAVLVACGGTAALRSPMASAMAVAAAIGLAILGRVPWRAIRGRLELMLIAVFPVLVVLPVTLDPDGPGWAIGPLNPTRHGLAVATGVALRALAIGTFALVLTRTTPSWRTFAAAGAIGVPGVLVQLAQLCLRYSFLLAEESRRVRVAMRARGFRPRTDAHSFRTLGYAVGGVLVRGGERAEQVAAAMRCRGFDGVYRTATPFRTAPSDVLAFTALAIATLGLVVADRM